MGLVTRVFSVFAAAILNCVAGLVSEKMTIFIFSSSGKEYNAQTHPYAFQNSP